jgi:uncharacterized protein (DUF1778 family)
MEQKRIEVRVTADQERAIREAAERAGLTVAGWVRTVALREARETAE